MMSHRRTSLLSDRTSGDPEGPHHQGDWGICAPCLFVSLACYNLYTCFSADVWHHLSPSTDGIYLDLRWDAHLGWELPFQSVLQEAVYWQPPAAAPKGWLESSCSAWEGTWQFNLSTSASAPSSARHVLCCAFMFLCCCSTCAVSAEVPQRGEEMAWLLEVAGVQMLPLLW